MANKQSAELTEPSVGSFDDPSALVTPELATVFKAPELAVLTVRDDEVNAPLGQSFPQRIGVISAIGDYAFRPRSRTTFRSRDFDFGERGFRKRNFSRRGTFQPNSQRNTFTVSQYHPLCAFTTLGFTDCFAPFLAAAKLPSRKASSHFSKPFSSNAPSSVRQALSQTPVSSHCFNRRQQVEGEGYSSGRKCHAAPVRSIHRMPSRQLRFGAGGRPRPSLRRFASGNSGPSNSHCSSVNSFCRFFMTEAQQPNTLKRKYLA